MELSQLQLEDIILYHKYLYYVKADPMISDYQYDQIEEKLCIICPNSKILTDITECPREFHDKYEKRYQKFKKDQLVLDVPCKNS